MWAILLKVGQSYDTEYYSKPKGRSKVVKKLKSIIGGLKGGVMCGWVGGAGLESWYSPNVLSPCLKYVGRGARKTPGTYFEAAFH